MKKGTTVLIILLVSICLMPGAGIACTTFVLDNNGQPVYGKNFDWQHVPCFVIVNKRGVAKTSIPFTKLEPDAQQISWTSKFGSVTFPYFGREEPFEGINEAGLFVSSMGLFQDTEYPPPDSRTPVNVFQWVQYQLDNFSTVEEVIASDTSVRIPGQGSGGGHYLVSDSKGNCASIEFLGGKLVCHTGATMPYKVLANSTYDQSVAFLKWFWGYGGIFPIFHPVFYRDSLPRFVIAADMVQKYRPQDSGDAVDYAFQVLQAVEMRPILKSAVWSVVYDSANKQVHFRSWNNDRIRWFDISSFDFSCTTPVKVLDISADLSGDVSKNFIDYTREIDLEMLKGAILPGGAKLTDAAIDYYATYPDNKTACTEK